MTTPVVVIEAIFLPKRRDRSPPEPTRKAATRCSVTAECDLRLLRYGSEALLIVKRELRGRFVRLKLIAHCPDLRCLRFESCPQILNLLLLLRDHCFLFRNGIFQVLHAAMLFKKLVEQYRVHSLATHGVNIPLIIASQAAAALGRTG